MARRVPLDTREDSMMLAWVLVPLPKSIVVVVLAQMLASAGAEPARVSARDSLRLARRARDAQAQFELIHRDYLPVGYGGDGGSGFCDARIGRFCYWSDDDDDTSPPPESPRVVRARTELLATLDSIASLVPGNDWIAGQRVRYRIDAGNTAGAVTVARSCGATTWWCDALAGFALHEDGRVGAADSAFDAALAAMPESERCRWTDISLLFDGGLSDRYRRLGCTARDSLAARVWWLSAPLYLVGRGDFRSEILARVTRARIEERARSTQTSWGDDVRELMLRYGWSTWYSRIPPPIGSMDPPSVIGHDPSPSFAFVPDNIAVDSPFTLRSAQFRLRQRGARVRYAPSYLRSVHDLRHQLAVFRRGDSALVVGAFDVTGDTTLAGRNLSSGLFLWSGPQDVAQAVRDDSAAREALTAEAPWRPLVIGLEVLARKERSAARVRIGRELRPGATGITVSDLLLYAAGPSTPRRLADVLPTVLPSATVRRRDPLGLFWETYGLSAQGQTLGVSVTIARIDEGWIRRTAEALRIAEHGAPLSVRWHEVPEAETGIASRAVAVDLSRLPAGRYRVSLTVSADGASPIIVSRTIEIVE